MKQIKIYFVLFMIILFFLGAYIYTTIDIERMLSRMGLKTCENMENDKQLPSPIDPERIPKGDQEESDDCPNLLVKKGTTLLLYNTKKPDVAGENPIMFYTMDEYIHHFETEKKKGKRCPVLYLEEENGAQGNTQYRVRTVQDIVLPDKFLQPLIPQESVKYVERKDANTMNPPYNQNMYAGYDATSQYAGRITDLDLIHASTEKVPVSDNAMDTNWGGVRFSQAVVASGKYDDDKVTRISYPTPRGANFIPIPNPYIPPYPPSA